MRRHKGAAHAQAKLRCGCASQTDLTGFLWILRATKSGNFEKIKSFKLCQMKGLGELLSDTGITI